MFKKTTVQNTLVKMIMASDVECVALLSVIAAHWWVETLVLFALFVDQSSPNSAVSLYACAEEIAVCNAFSVYICK